MSHSPNFHRETVLDGPVYREHVYDNTAVFNMANKRTSPGRAPAAFVAGEIGLVRSLGEVGIPVYVGTPYRDNIALYSRYCKRRLLVAPSSTNEFVDDLVRFGQEVGERMIFFSDDDRAVLTVSRFRDRLKPYYRFLFPDRETVDALLDKRKFAHLASSLGLPVPMTLHPRCGEELESTMSEIRYPCVLKPVHKEDWWHPEFLTVVGSYRKAILCRDRGELMVNYRNVTRIHKDVVVQEYVGGDDSNLYSVNMYFNTAGELGAYFIGHKIRIYPIHAGVGCLVETVRDEEMVAMAVNAARRMRIRGHFNLQFKRDPDTKQLFIMEAHPRNSLWCYLATGSGVNITAYAYYDMIGQEYPYPIRVRSGVKWVDLNKDIKALREYRKTGEWSLRSWWKSLKGPKVFHVHSLTDPVPLLADTWFILKRYLRDNIRQHCAPRV